MKKKILLLLLVISSINFSAQTSFEKGYYINNSNQKIDCLIKNLDWVYNPTEFEYRLTENDESKVITINSVKEFGIYNTLKYIKENINIDISDDNLNKLSRNKKPIYQEKEFFLKVILEGEYNLYKFFDGNLKRFFYNRENLKIEQLVYKSYRTDENKIGENNYFRQQLWKDLKCSEITLNKIKSIDYDEKSLFKFFKLYNECKGYEVISYKEKKDFFNLNIKPRINNSSLLLKNNGSNPYNINLDNKTTFGLGIEAEFFLSFNNKKWSIIVEPTYQNYKSEKTIDKASVSGGQITAKIDYNSIEIPIGLRRYFFINQNSSIFINISAVYDLNSKSTIDLNRNDGSNLNFFDIHSKNNMALGVGYKQNNKYSIEARYQSDRELLGNVNWRSDYSTFSIIFGYTLF